MSQIHILIAVADARGIYVRVVAYIHVSYTFTWKGNSKTENVLPLHWLRVVFIVTLIYIVYYHFDQ